MHLFEYKSYVRNYPEMWNELSKDQLIRISAVLMKDFNRAQQDFIILKILLDIPHNEMISIHAEDLSALAESIVFLRTKKELTVNLLPSLKIGRKIFIGPQNALSDITFNQFFAHALPAIQSFSKSNDDNDYNYFLASLYSYDGVFDDKTIEKNAIILAKLKPAEKHAILLFWLGSLDFLATKFPELFQKKEKKTLGKIDDSTRYFQLIENLNNENIANNELVKNANLYEAFTRITNLIKKHDELKKIKK